MSHALHDAVSLALAKRIAKGLSEHPEWISLARGNLDKWTRLNQDAPALVANYREWREILEKPMSEIVAILVAPGDEGQRLRQNSPFAGVLTAAEVWEIKRVVRETAPV